MSPLTMPLDEWARKARIPAALTSRPSDTDRARDRDRSQCRPWYIRPLPHPRAGPSPELGRDPDSIVSRTFLTIKFAFTLE